MQDLVSAVESATTQVFEECGDVVSRVTHPLPEMKIWSGLGTLSFELDLPRIPTHPLRNMEGTCVWRLTTDTVSFVLCCAVSQK